MVKHLSHLRKNEALAASVCFFAIFIIFVLGLSVTGALVGAGTTSICGNGACEVGENIINCGQDCTAICGNAVCESAEKFVCPIDCKPGSEETKSVGFQYSLIFVIFAAILLIVVLWPISRFGNHQKARKKSPYRGRR